MQPNMHGFACYQNNSRVPSHTQQQLSQNYLDGERQNTFFPINQINIVDASAWWAGFVSWA